MKKRVALFLATILVAISMLEVSVSAAQVYGQSDSVSADVTVNKTNKEQASGRIENTIGFEVVWEDTEVDLEQTSRYALVWNPQTLKYEKVMEEGFESYYLYDEVKCTITNLSPVKIFAVPTFNPADGFEAYLDQREGHKRTSENTWSYASEHSLGAVTGIDEDNLDVAAEKGETGEYKVILENKQNVSSNVMKELWEALEDGDTLGTVTISVSPDYN